MYKYLIFGFDQYYPCGGMNDLLAKFNNMEDLEANLKKYWESDKYQLVNIESMQTIDFKLQVEYTESDDDKKTKFLETVKNMIKS